VLRVGDSVNGSVLAQTNGLRDAIAAAGEAAQDASAL
jgi:hypothetical protein